MHPVSLEVNITFLMVEKCSYYLRSIERYSEGVELSAGNQSDSLPLQTGQEDGAGVSACPSRPHLPILAAPPPVHLLG